MGGQPRAKDAGGPKNEKQPSKQILPWSFRRKQSWGHLGLGTSGLQNCESPFAFFKTPTATANSYSLAWQI